MNKGERTRDTLLDHAMKFSAVHGLAKVTIGEISKRAGMSRTGVISHFKNKEDMQLAILLHIEQRFIERVMKPSYDDEAIVGLKNFLLNWATWTNKLKLGDQGSCPLVRVPMEFAHQKDSPIYQLIRRQQIDLLKHIEKIAKRCIRQGTFVKSLNTKEFALEVVSTAYGYYLIATFFGTKGAINEHEKRIDGLLERYKTNKKVAS